MSDEEEIPDPIEEDYESPAEGIIPLGYDHDIFYYLSRSAKQVFAISAAAHSKNMLMALASVPHFWQRGRFVSQKGGVLWEEAIDWMMNGCRQVGVFDPARIRGRGAWLDDGRAVLHVGDRLLVDGIEQSLALSGSKHVYEAARSLNGEFIAPLSTKEAHRVVTLCGKLAWERSVSGTLLAGFIVVAPICGGMEWRPSIWITGGAGSGKSWVVEKLMAPLMGGMAVRVQSKTSEAGIRQLLGSDALPVIFDEAEREDAASSVRMQGVLDLVRQASSESGAEIVKGSQNQTGAKRYRTRSSFAFSSINVGIEHQADDSRITVLALRTPTEEADPATQKAFQTLQAEAHALITHDYASGLLARSVRLLPIIRANADTFARAVAAHVSNRRTGDQIGTLLAGAYSLHSDRLVSWDDAVKYVQRQEWIAAATDRQTERDEIRLVHHLLQSRLRYTPGNGAPQDVTIARLLTAVWDGDETISRDIAARELAENGLRPDDAGGIYVSTSHPTLKRLFAGTPWAAGWGRSLARLPGSVSSAKTLTRFTRLFVSRAVWVSKGAISGEAV